MLEEALERNHFCRKMRKSLNHLVANQSDTYAADGAMDDDSAVAKVRSATPLSFAIDDGRENVGTLPSPGT